MASFTDQIMQFNPYVKQLPTEAMAKVGMYKQQKYEEGVQKIQSEIDRIAGLDIYKPLHKEYLQSKLNELGGKLKTVAAGDFSNFQLVNSVGGMATQIGKDPTIQNAVASTQRVRKGMEDMETARKAGKSSPENEWWFNNQKTSWLNDNDLNSTFNGSFLEYRDVNKKLIDLAEKIKEVENITESPFKRDTNGNVLVGKDGKPIIDDAILSVKTKGKSADKLLKMFNDSLDENDKQQLMITGNYEYRGATKETFAKDITDNYNNNKKILSDELVNLSVQLKTDDKLSSADKAKIQARITDINNAIDSGILEKRLNEDLSGINNITNLDDFKYKLYKDKFVTNLAKDLSYQSYQYEYKNNPYAQMDMQRRDLQFKYDNAAREQRNSDRDFALRVRQFDWEKTKKAKEELDTSPVVTTGRLPTNVNIPTLAKLDADIKSSQDARKQLDGEYANQLFPKLKGVEKQKALDEMFAKYNQDPSSITDNAQREYLERRRGFDMIIAQKQALYTGVVEQSKKFDEDFKKIIGAEGGVVTTGGSQLYSATELYERFRDLQTSNKWTPSGPGSRPQKMLDVAEIMSKYKGTKYEPIARAYIKKQTNQPLTSVEQAILGKAENIFSKYDSRAADIANKKATFQSEELARLMPERQTQIGTLDLKNNKVDEARVTQLLGNKFKEYADLGALDTKGRGDFSPEKINDWLTSKGADKLIYTVEKNYDGSANLIIQKGGESQIVPMKAAEFSAFFPKYAVSHPLNDVISAVRASRNHTTNVTGSTGDPSAAVNAYFTGHDIPGIKGTAIAPLVRLDVEGSPRNTGEAGDKYQVRMYVNDKGIWKTAILNQGGYVTEDGVQAILQNIGTHTVSDVLKSN